MYPPSDYPSEAASLANPNPAEPLQTDRRAQQVALELPTTATELNLGEDSSDSDTMEVEIADDFEVTTGGENDSDGEEIVIEHGASTPPLKDEGIDSSQSSDDCMELNFTTPPERAALPTSQENPTDSQTALQHMRRMNFPDSVSANPRSAIGLATVRKHGVVSGVGVLGSEVPLGPASYQMQIPVSARPNITHSGNSSLYPSPAKFWSPESFAASRLMAFEGGETHALTVSEVDLKAPSGTGLHPMLSLARLQRFERSDSTDQTAYASAYHLLEEDNNLQSAFRDIAEYFGERMIALGESIRISQEESVTQRKAVS